MVVTGEDFSLDYLCVIISDLFFSALFDILPSYIGGQNVKNFDEDPVNIAGIVGIYQVKMPFK